MNDCNLEVQSRGEHIFSSAPSVGLANASESLIAFSAAGVEIMRIDQTGMVYKGQRIEDVGEAHRAFLEVMREMKVVR